MRHHHFINSISILLLLVSSHALAQQPLIPYDHVIPGYLFDVYENEKMVPKKVWLWIDANKSTQTVVCNLIYILPQKEDESITLEAHHYSNIDQTISNIEIDSKRVSFDLSLSSLIQGRTIRVACDGSTPKYNVRALGLWRIIDGSGTIKVEWKPTDEIRLPYSRIVNKRPK